MREGYFNINHYRYSIFNGELPSKVVFPFSYWRSSPFVNRGFKMKLVRGDHEILREDLKSSIKILSESMSEDVGRFGEYLLLLLKTEYVNLKVDWIIDSNGIIDKIVDERSSKVLWEVYKYQGSKVLHTEDLHELQMLWIFLNSMKDKEQDIDISSNMFEFLASYVNPEMFMKAKERKEARENAAFDDMHEALVKGDMDMFDSIERVN